MVNNKGYTIQEIANIAGVPKITMYKFISNGPYKGTIGARNARIYSETVQNRIIFDFNKTIKSTTISKPESVNLSTDTYLSSYINSLESQIDHLKSSLNEKTSEIVSYQKLLDQSQQLQLDLQHQLQKNEQNKTQLLIENKELSDSLLIEKRKNFWTRLFNLD